MVQAIAGVLLVLHPRHQDGKDREEEEIPKADPQHGVRLEPLSVGSRSEVVYPGKFLHEGGGDFAEDPGDDEGEGEEAAVGDASGAAADAADNRPAGLARAGGAARSEARRSPHR